MNPNPQRCEMEEIFNLALELVESSQKPSYKSRPIKRKRRTRTEIEALKEAMLTIAAEHEPLTIRNLFYLMVSQDLIEKTENEYKNVTMRLAGELRDSGEMPFEWIVDNTRWMRKRTTYDGLDDMFEQTIRLYRRELWTEQPYYFEVWCESDSIAGLLYEVTDPWTIPLMVCRGFASKTFLREPMIEYQHIQKPIKLLYFGDYDPSGMAMDKQIKQAINQYANGSNVAFIRCAVTELWIDDLNLPTRPVKKTDSRSKTWKGGTVEIEAIPPKELTSFLNDLIERVIDQEALKQVKLAEEAERKTLMDFRRTFKESKGK